MPVGGDVLRAWRRARGWDVPETARRLRKAAKGAPVADHEALVRMVRRWEREGLRTERYELLYAAALGVSADELAAGPDDGDDGASRRDALVLGFAMPFTPEVLTRVLSGAAAEAMEFTRLAGVTAVGSGVLSHLEAVIAGIGRAYCTEPPGHLFPLARAYRAQVENLARGPCTLREQRDLYVCAAWLSEALAWLSHDLGHPVAAEAYAIDAFEHADQAGHGELCAWAADAMSSIALYTGRPHRAAQVALDGAKRAPAGHPLAVRLRAQAARAHAKLGQREECEALLEEAQCMFEKLPSRTPVRDGIDTGVLAAYAVTDYPTSSYVWLEDFRRAESYGRRAVAEHKTAPAGSRSPAREAIARIDLAIAVMELGAPDEGAELGCQALRSPRVVNSVLARAGDLDAALSAHYPGQEDASTFHEQYVSVTSPRAIEG